MKVKVGNRMYQMGRTEYNGLLNMAREQVPFGIYAVEKQGFAELRCDRCKSMTQLKKLTRQYQVQGFRVLSNKEGYAQKADDSADAGPLRSAT